MKTRKFYYTKISGYSYGIICLTLHAFVVENNVQSCQKVEIAPHLLHAYILVKMQEEYTFCTSTSISTEIQLKER